jgi:predicted ATPase/DNA-binding CsgD family transcriptional regulator
VVHVICYSRSSTAAPAQEGVEMQPLTTSRIPVHLPPQPTRLVDREEEQARLRSFLSHEDIRLLTLTGPGGVGKTRLAIAAAEQMQERFPDGVWFVDLAPLVDPALVVPTMARVVGAGEQPGQDPANTLAEYLGERSVLLVVDNLEHLLGAVHALEALVMTCPNLTILATSREPMRLRREQVVVVLPLPVPDPAVKTSVEDLASMPSVALFVARAQAADTSFTLSEQNAAAVAELSRRLDGLPLAVELAAARSRMLAPSALLARMEHSLALLRWDAPDLPPRHRTLHATLDWSYALLSPTQQALFRRLSVFAGGFTLAGAEAVSSDGWEAVENGGAGEGLFYRRPASPDRPPTVLDDLAALIDHSLMQRIAGAPRAEPRYRLLETVREFGRERLDDSGETDAVRRLHLTYLVALAEHLAEQILLPEGEQVLTRLDAEHDDIRVALAYAEATGQALLGQRLARAMINYWRARGLLREGRDWLERALKWREAPPSTGGGPGGEPTPSAERARVLGGIGWLAQFQGDLDRAETALGEAVAMAVAVGARMTEARARNALAMKLLHQGSHAEAAAMMDQALLLFRELEPKAIAGPLHVSQAYTRRGLIARLSGDLNGAADYLDEAERRLRALGHTWARSETLHYLGDVARDRGDLTGALVRYRESLASAWESVDRIFVADALDGVASVAATRGQAECAARWHGTAGALRERLGAAVPPWEREAYERDLAAVRKRLSEEAFAEAWKAGAALPLETAVAETLADAASDSPASAARAVPDPAAAAGLTAREVEVLRLVAQGQTNNAIADALFIAPSTVKTHVASLLAKLDADNRAHLAIIAVQRGLLFE